MEKEKEKGQIIINLNPKNKLIILYSVCGKKIFNSKYFLNAFILADRLYSAAFIFLSLFF